MGQMSERDESVYGGWRWLGIGKVSIVRGCRGIRREPSIYGGERRELETCR